MEIKTLKDLEGLVKLMRKQGISSIKIDNMELQLGSEPVKASKATKDLLPTLAPGGITEEIKVPTDGFPTAEELLMWSTGEGQ